jgi:diguanylate cyclase (GGDEF)-like protein
MEDGTIVVDNHLRVVDMNPAAQAILNQKLGDVLGKSYFQILPAAGALMLAPKGDSPLQSELTVDVGGQDRRYEIRMTNLYDSRREINGHLILLRDTTQRRQTEEKLHLLAITDPLTGLFNRRHFFSVAELEFERARRSDRALSILIFDVDHFKQINDTFGHIVGDQVLQALAQLCLGSLRKYDVMARYGGEEFVIMLPETEIDQAYLIGERLRSKIEHRVFDTNAGPAHITVSLGIANLKDQQDTTFDKLLDCSDQALYDAKIGGRNIVRVWKESSTLEQ